MKRSIWDYKHIHMIGVKGVGMTALAQVLVSNGFDVDGSDVSETFMTDDVLAKLGIAVTPFDARRLKGANAAIRSNAYTAATNDEVKAAEHSGMPLFSYPEVVAELFNAHYGIAVAGSHGKTTTTAMLAHILHRAQKNVTAIVGSKVLDWQCGALAGDLSKPDALFVLEADEYKEAFLHYHPKGAIITNIDYDHPDYFKTPRSYNDAFEKFIRSIPAEGFVVINSDDTVLRDATRYASCRIISISKDDTKEIKMKLIGKHNQMNAAMALAAARELGVPDKTAREALADFQGTSRRMEYIGEKDGTLIFDDYAHHPTEIKASLAGLRKAYPKKQIIAVFQPHTYSRTKALFSDFAGAFTNADSVILTDVYASAREKKEENMVDMADMASAMERKGKSTLLIKNRAHIASTVRRLISPDAVVVTLGAGDIWQVSRALLER